MDIRWRSVSQRGKKKGRREKNLPPLYSTRTRSVSRITTFWAGIRCKRPFNHQTECTIGMRIVYLLNLPPPPPPPSPPLPTLLSKRQLRDPTETGCHHDDYAAHSAQDAIKFLPFQSPFFGKRECVAGRRLIRHACSRPKGGDKHHHHQKKECFWLPTSIRRRIYKNFPAHQTAERGTAGRPLIRSR